MSWDQHFERVEIEEPKPDQRRRPQANGDGLEQATPSLVPLSMASLASLTVPPMRFVVGEWVPWGKPVLLSGRGGGGKTTFACQLAAARAIGAAFLGMPAEPGSSLALLCEEDAEDAHRMLARHADHLGRSLAEFGRFHYLPRAGEDNALVARTSKGAIVTTPFYELMAQAIGDCNSTLNILDNARHVACINENDGSEVTAAWSLLHRLSRTTGGTTILLGHTPKAGTAEFSGNAAWENVARSRLFLGPAKQDSDAEPIENDPRRILRRGKSNASGTASLELVWERGAFRLENPGFITFGEQLDREMRRGAACQVFLDALGELTKQRRNVSHSSSGRNYAPKVMKEAGLCDGFGRAELEAAMNDLFRDGRIVANAVLWKGADRHPVTGIARGGVA